MTKAQMHQTAQTVAVLVIRTFVHSDLFGHLMLVIWCFAAAFDRHKSRRRSTAADGRQLLLENFRPRPMLKVEQHELTRAKFPVVDVHTHFRDKFRGSGGGAGRVGAADGPEQHRRLRQPRRPVGRAARRAREAARGRSTGTGLRSLPTSTGKASGKADDPATWDCQRPDFARRTARELAAAKERGACGVKIFKEFGLGYKNADGSLIKIDDPRWDGIWQACGELGLPVLIHVGRSGGVLPADRRDERALGRAAPPARLELFRPAVSQARGTARRAQSRASSGIRRRPSSRPTSPAMPKTWPRSASGSTSIRTSTSRSPVADRRAGPPAVHRPASSSSSIRTASCSAPTAPGPKSGVRLYWRFLETEDEYFPYSEKPFPPQGLWNIYGLNLPDDVLRKVYHENAARIIPGVRERLERLGQ